jgi:hypothetical protein
VVKAPPKVGTPSPFRTNIRQHSPTIANIGRRQHATDVNRQARQRVQPPPEAKIAKTGWLPLAFLGFLRRFRLALLGFPPRPTLAFLGFSSLWENAARRNQREESRTSGTQPRFTAARRSSFRWIYDVKERG